MSEFLEPLCRTGWSTPSWGAGAIPFRAPFKDGEASGESDWHDDLAADLADPPVPTLQQVTAV